MKALVFLGSLLALFGCSCKSEGDEQTSKQASAPISLASFDGVWKSDCVIVGGGYYLVATMANEAGSSRYDIVLYNTSSCSVPLRRETSQRTFTIVGDAPGLTNVKKVDIAHGPTSAALLTQEGVDEANDFQLYGFTDWALNVEKDITGLSEEEGGEPTPMLGEMTYQIYKLENDEIAGGDWATGDGLTDATRPTSIHPAMRLRKQ